MGREKGTVESKSRAVPTIYVICEGLTEIKYLQHFEQNNRNGGRFELILFDKVTFDRNQSDRKELIKMIRGELDLRITGKYTPHRYVSAVLHNCYDNSLESLNHRDREKISDEINGTRMKIVSLICQDMLDEYGHVENFNGVDGIICQELAKMKNNGVLKLHVCTDLANPDMRYPEPKTEFKNIDRVFIVIDRDYDPKHDKVRTDQYYYDIIAESEKLGYEILISTPMFEYWLLLHHEDVNPDAYDVNLQYKDYVLEDLKFHEEKNCKDWENKNIAEVKNISNERWKNNYANSFKTALELSKKRPTDPKELVTQVGTNVGVKLESLIKLQK